MPAVIHSYMVGRQVPRLTIQSDTGMGDRTAHGRRQAQWLDVFNGPGRLTTEGGDVIPGSPAGESLDSGRRTVLVNWFPGFPRVLPYPKSRLMIEDEEWRIDSVNESMQPAHSRRLVAISVTRTPNA